MVFFVLQVIVDKLPPNILQLPLINQVFSKREVYNWPSASLWLCAELLDAEL